MAWYSLSAKNKTSSISIRGIRNVKKETPRTPFVLQTETPSWYNTKQNKGRQGKAERMKQAIKQGNGEHNTSLGLRKEGQARYHAIQLCNPLSLHTRNRGIWIWQIHQPIKQPVQRIKDLIVRFHEPTR